MGTGRRLELISPSDYLASELGSEPKHEYLGGVVNLLVALGSRLRGHAYLSLPSLQQYWLVEQEEAAIVTYRRTDQGFQREVFAELEAAIPIPALNLQIPLSEIYERVHFGPEEDAQGSTTL
ncbi:hypothetical protein ABS71_17380 [bacterium SCN 62-11]|nr:Uma2 family endonuclease [Candidatus Eremiobacteraeota bacterium]ODT60362.1 MAG: hypothetical protein ABS71_17380 [bacterium SCN 62-11]